MREVGKAQGWGGRQGGKGNKEAYRLRIGSWNIGTLTVKSIELAKILQKRNEELDEIVHSIPPEERLFIGKDFNSHIGSTAGGYGEGHDGFRFGDRNGGGTSLLDFVTDFELVIANSSFPKREAHLVTFQSTVVKTQIDYLLLGRCDIGLCKDCKVIPGDILAMQHRLLVMDVGIMIKRMKRFV
ncbi:uncharacterized protein LOC142181067 [Nicotiana tabacum]|uniref:Uncharacterized protein LOC142181067 n=1 Tax=Nicotiana tabacum TaxID=4097 RepID=A0AC58UJB1_TOBAC